MTTQDNSGICCVSQSERRLPKSRYGISLLELMIVLVIMTGALAIAWPNLRKPLQRSALHEAAQTVRVALDDARFQAIATGHFWFVRLEQSSDRIEYGRFMDFASNQTDHVFGGLSDSPTSRSGIPDQNLPTLNESSQSPRDYKLPAQITVAEVVMGPLKSNELPVTGETSGDSADSLSEKLEPSQWCIPLPASGTGRDATIRLVDNATNESILVIFSASTGAIEIY
jgi:type II secretory pathway pseudopilin PulG